MINFKKSLERRPLGDRGALRIFHGPGEGEGEGGPERLICCDKYGEHAWVSVEGESLPEKTLADLRRSLAAAGFQSAAVVYRHRRGGHTEPAEALLGELPEPFTVENCGLRFEIRFRDQRHPGLFLDMDFARRWLKQNSGKKRVLNLFSYTGSLSVAAGAGGAAGVTSVDLSKPFTRWAETNWRLNRLPEEAGEFLFGDSFDWLKRWKRQKRVFDLIVCDPPSFSSGRRAFSTAKNLGELHDLIFQVMAPEGELVTSINSSGISQKRFLSEILEAAKRQRRTAVQVEEFSLPPEFPTRRDEDKYLKGAILRANLIA
jgi:23S rRNA (cytosine1962-C5)-methyltransferase